MARYKPEGYLFTHEYAKQNYVTDNAVRQLIHRGRLEPLRIGGRVYIKEGTPYPEREKKREEEE